MEKLQQKQIKFFHFGLIFNLTIENCKLWFMIIARRGHTSSVCYFTKKVDLV